MLSIHLSNRPPTSIGSKKNSKTDKPIPKELVFDCMKAINAAKAPEGTKIGDVLIKGVLGTDANIVATANA